MKSNIDWQHKTEMDPTSCLGMVGQRCHWTNGKVLGGSSATNTLLYIRGNPGDYDSWKANDSLDWGYEDALRYFKKSEGIKDRKVLKNPKFERFHKTNGFLNVDRFKDSLDLGEIILEAEEELGHAILTDFNADIHLGFGYAHGTILNGLRQSSASAFLKPVKDRNNLDVIKFAEVTKILIDKEIKKVTGVEFILRGKTLKVMAKNEVILSAGAINSPKVLMLSGIGPKEHLNDVGIETIIDLPVGENLQDHFMSPVFYKAHRFNKTKTDFTWGILKFLIKQKGMFGSIGTLDVTGFLKTNENNTSYPDIQFQFYTLPANSQEPWKFFEKLGLNEEIQNSYSSMNTDFDLVQIYVTLLKPVSKGKIMLNSKNASDKPLIYANYLENEADIDTLVKGIREAEKLETTNTFKKEGLVVSKLDYAACDHFIFRSEDYWRCTISHMGSSANQQIGTVKMGPVEDVRSVVGPTLKVKGVEGLRVADASIMPGTISGKINAACIMIGEKAADFVKEEWFRSGMREEL